MKVESPRPGGSCAQATGYLWGIQGRRFGPFASPPMLTRAWPTLSSVEEYPGSHHVLSYVQIFVASCCTQACPETLSLAT